MKERIVLPKQIYMLSGKNEQFHIYYQNAVIGLSPDEIVNIVCQYGRQYRDFWRMEPGASEIAHYHIAQGEFPLCLQLLNRDLEVIAEQVTSIIIVPKEEKSEIPVLCIGDSITRNGDYASQVQQSLPWVRSIGTRTYDNGKVNREGRGGWTAEHYLKRFGEMEEGDSPYLFPVRKEHESSFYWGNTNFWKCVVSEDSSGYAYDGFQQAAASIGQDGFPLFPKVGDTICEPIRGIDKAICRWDGLEWVTMQPQPQWEFDFAQYLERFDIEMPNIVSFLFGANEFQIVNRIDEYVDTFLESIQQMIDAIHACNPNIRFIINLPVAGADQDAWGLQLGCSGSAKHYRRHIQEASLAILRRWDHAESRKRGIFICPMLLVVDPYYGFERSIEPVNKYVSQLIERHNNWVHPGVVGHCQMGDILASTIQAMIIQL